MESPESDPVQGWVADVTWPTGPPPMPRSGWYHDPDHPWTWRYFDGAHWTDHRSPMWVPPARDERSFSAWFERSVAAVKLAVERVGLMVAALWIALGAMSALLVVAVFDSDRGQELRGLLDVDQGSFGPTASTGTVELTTAEADRAWELAQDLFWSALPWLLVLGVAAVVASAWSVAVVARTVNARVSTAHSDTAANPDDEPRAVLAADAIRRTPAVILSGLLVLLVFCAVWLAGSLPVVLVVAAGGSGAAIALTVVFVVLLLAVTTVWLWGRLTLASVIAAVGGHGLGVRRSWELTHGRFWFVVARLVVTGLVAGAGSWAVNVFVSFGQFLGFAAFAVIALLLQAAAVLVAMVVTVCGHLVAVDQVDDDPPWTN